MHTEQTAVQVRYIREGYIRSNDWYKTLLKFGFGALGYVRINLR